MAIHSHVRRALIVLTLCVLANASNKSFAQTGGRGFFGFDPRAPQNQFSKLALSSNGIVAGTDRDSKCVRLWDVEKGTLRHKLEGLTGSVQALSFSGDSRTLAISDEDKTIALFDTQSGERTKALNGHRSDVQSLAFSPDGKTLASANEEGEFFLWNIERGEVIHRFPQPKCWINAFAFLPDGETLLAPILEQEVNEVTSSGVRFLNLKSGQQTANLRLVPFRPRWVAISSDGKQMAYSSRGLVLLWDIPTQTLLRALVSGSGDDEVNQLAFSRDGLHLAAATSRHIMRIWDVTTTRQVWQRNFSRHVLHLSFKHDGSTLVTANRECLRLYDFESSLLRREWFPQGDTLRDQDPKVVGRNP